MFQRLDTMYKELRTLENILHYTDRTFFIMTRHSPYFTIHQQLSSIMISERIIIRQSIERARSVSL